MVLVDEHTHAPTPMRRVKCPEPSGISLTFFNPKLFAHLCMTKASLTLMQ
jgi:hypothetical protein